MADENGKPAGEKKPAEKTSRRGSGAGTVGKRTDGRWWARIDLGYVNGKRKRKVIYGQSRKEVQQKLTALLRDQQLGINIDPERMTVDAYLKEWLGRGAVLLNIRPSTFDSYSRVVRLYIIPILGRLQIKKLAPRDLNNLYAELLKTTSKKTEKPLSAKTVHYAHSILHRALKDALKEEVILRNPADAVTPPRPEKHELTPPGQEQLLKFLQEARKDRLFALYIVAITCGLRQGELLGLKWIDVNFDRAELHIRRKVYRVPGKGWDISEPKTAKGRRMIALPALTVEALRQHKAAQNEERLLAGPLWRKGDWIFCTHEGGLMERQALVFRRFKPLLELAGLPSSTRFHDLRHAMATVMLEDGIHPKVVQERLGHATISVTLDTYSHVKPKLQREAAAMFDTHFEGLL